MLALQYTFGNRYIVDEAILLFFLTLFLSCSDGDRMRGLMGHVDSLNQCYASLADDSVMPSVVSWMDRHGTANERMRAHYLAGCVYRDRQQAPEALDWYHGAALCADTASNDCDFKCLSRIYSQISGLYADQNMMETALETSDKAIYYAWMCKDTAAVLALMDNNSVYDYYLGNEDKALATIFRVHDLYCLYGDTLTANTALGPAIGIYLAKGEYGKAESLLEKYEHQSLLTGQEPFCEKQFYYLYCYKGLCFIETERYDSASYCFRKQINEGGTIDNVERGSQGLYKLYQKLGIIDSVSKYADICFSLKDSIAEASVYATLQQMQSLYDYSRHQSMAFQKAKEASILRQRMTAVFSCSVILVLSAFCLAFFAIKKKRLQVEKLTEEYQLRIRQIQDAKAEIEKATFNDYMERQRAELDDGQQKLHDLLGISYGTTPVDVCSNEVYSCFMEAATHPRVKVTQTDWKRLHNLFAEKIPNFRNQLTHGKAISESDMRLCMLIRMHFTVSEICVLLDTYSQYVSNRRCQLLKKFYQIKGKAEDFDRIVSMIN